MVTRTLAAQTPCLSSAPSVSETDHRPTTLQDEERQLLCRIAAQETQAFDTLYTRYAPRVRSYLTSRLRPPELIDEVLQDVMLTLWRQAARVPHTVPLIAWLCGVARHKSYKASARTFAPTLVSATPEDLDCDEPETLLLRKEHGLTLTRALATLPPAERTALTLRLYQGRSYQEIAAATGSPVSTMRTRVSRACYRLRMHIAALERQAS